MIKFKEILLLQNLHGVGNVSINTTYYDILGKSKDIEDLISKMEDESKFSRKILEMARDDAEEFYQNMVNDSEIHVITIFDENYPDKLNDMEKNKPPILYVKGNVKALEKPNIAVIGTRKPSTSQLFEECLVKAILQTSDRVIVSGLALGCDKTAHQTTVNENKQTVAVLPSGVNVVKPAKNKQLAQDIIDAGGCLVSEYRPDVKPNKGNYVKRDSIVAALCDATFVVECGVGSGTMHTVNAAKEYGRQIYAYLPFERQSGTYDGNEFILAEDYDAIKVEDIEEFLFDLNHLEVKKKPKSGQSTFDDFIK